MRLQAPYVSDEEIDNIVKTVEIRTTTRIINNSNNNTNINGGRVYRNEKNKWVALLLCIFLGGIGAHKFYEGKIGLGIVYLFTVGFFGIGWAIDFIVLLFKSNPYYV